VTELVFLGCGGGRHQTIDQSFKTGGFRIHGGKNVHVDPGPGAVLITRQLGLNPIDLDCVVATHCHPDHYADAEVLVEAMTHHMKRERGVLIGSESVLQGKSEWGPAVSKHHQRKVGKTVCLKPGEVHELGDLRLEATPAKHSDPTTFGLKFHTPDGIVGYTSDTQYFEELPKYFEGSRVLIVNVTRPRNRRIRWHLCSNDVIELLKQVKPELAVMMHMGMLFLRESPESEAGRIKEESGVETVPGHVGVRLRMAEKVSITRPSRQPALDAFASGNRTDR
jgi:phosphoribosyl 1,2-cyclic phosphodiesterase